MQKLFNNGCILESNTGPKSPTIPIPGNSSILCDQAVFLSDSEDVKIDSGKFDSDLSFASVAQTEDDPQHDLSGSSSVMRFDKDFKVTRFSIKHEFKNFSIGALLFYLQT